MENQEINQEILNNTVNEVLNFWTKGLTPVKDDEFDLSDLEIIMTSSKLKKIKTYPAPTVVENFVKKLAVYVILKLEKNKYFYINTKAHPQGEFGKMVLSSGIDSSLFPRSTTMKISLGLIKITDFLGQQEIIEIS